MTTLIMQMRRRLSLALAALLLVAANDARAQAPAGYQVIVNAANPVASVEARDLGRMFRKELTRWKDGSVVQPVDLRTQSPTRAAFTQQVHRRSVSAIAEFWRQQIFSGRNVPPVERASDAEVLEYVRTTPGAVGYVSAGAELGAQVKVLSVTGS